MMLTLAGTSKKGKQRVKQYGSAWRVVEKRDAVLFTDKRGPWLLIVPQGSEPGVGASRWIHGLTDDDFKVMPYAPE